MSVRSLLLTGLVVLALAVAYLLGGSAGSGTPAQAADDTGPTQPEHRVLTMTGTGDATAVPDQLSFGLTVSLTRPDLDTALADANAATERVLRALAGHGVDRRDVQTTGLSMHAVYDYPPYEPPTIRGYQVSQRASVHVDELADGGAAVSAAVAAGGDDVRIGNIRLLVGDSDAVMKQARDAAVAEAQAKAQQYAEASGQSLGDVVTLREVRTKPLPTATDEVGRMRGTFDAAALPSVPIRAGKEKGSVTVKVVWELR
ncbi:SIMPL domain-containing protein [Nocardioides mangrovi]|uniref:SIMPL domain-containing protein n=1 Tax=Nocardioides mangrovi TaxID=2874580 RepID=A0ABS7UKY5_9ACTN|nr:SIMPL domain-containing protein [Nocardioides mangrovi]MBZ5741283.1 SIMPL domain-containing protein [Nocardioides mangrovi]